MEDDFFAQMGRDFNSASRSKESCQSCSDDSYSVIEQERQLGRNNQGSGQNLRDLSGAKPVNG
ncbi:MAG: hypothetical protein RBR86_09095 [Pseudobdellovibrionaceae bacterium]|jgi:hypothetical protein|nr:hypothetical protein [Pseudobdellovibrionaceae bacterium]